MRNTHAQILLGLVAGMSLTKETLAQTITQPSKFFSIFIPIYFIESKN